MQTDMSAKIIGVGSQGPFMDFGGSALRHSWFLRGRERNLGTYVCCYYKEMLERDRVAPLSNSCCHNMMLERDRLALSIARLFCVMILDRDRVAPSDCLWGTGWARAKYERKGCGLNF